MRPWRMMPDKAAEATIDNLTSYFTLRDLGLHGSFREIEVEFDEQAHAEVAAEIRRSGLLRRWDVVAGIEARLTGVDARAPAFEAWLEREPLERPQTPIDKDCFKCEYDHSVAEDVLDAEVNVLRKADPRNGFRECWGKLAEPERHIRHLYRLGSLGGSEKGTKKIDELIALKLVDQESLGEKDLQNAQRKLSPTAARILIQIKHGKAGTEWLDEEALASELLKWRYPLHFIDFEASASPLPYHRAMRPYQTVVFQWSCHTIASPGAEPVHSDYLNTEAAMPARAFLESLRAVIGDAGTPLMWSPYENTQLRHLADWLRRMEPDTPSDLLAWVDDLVWIRENGEVIKEDRLVDQYALVGKRWFHPRMGGQTSIKVCLPAALQVTTSPRINRWLAADDLLLADGARPENPYKLLPALVPGVQPGDLDEGCDAGAAASGAVITDGVEAMRAYQDMVYGRHMNDEAWRDLIRDALLRYCRLDTLAQMIIWEHWRTRLGL